MSNSREFVMCNVLWTDYQPTDWVIQPVWQVFKIGRGRVIAETELNPNSTYPVYSSQTKNNGCLGFIDTYDFDCTQITWTTDGANAGTVFLRRGKHNCTNVCGTLLPLKPDRHDIHFYTFFLSYVTQFYKRPDTNGAKIMNGEMAAIRLAVPSFNEQRQIAAYLNRETAKIDKLIAKQQKLIKLLQEKRQAVISRVVTKGLNPAVSMKDSGLPWLGEVPTNWEYKALKYCLKSLTQGWSPQCESFPAFGPDEQGVLKVGCVNGGTFSPEQNKRLPQDLEFDPLLSLKSGDLLISRANTKELVGSAAVVPADFPNLFLCDKLYRLRFKSDYSPQFISYYLSTGGCREAIELGASGASASMQNISQDVILNLTVPAPELDEQLKIVAYLQRQLAVFDELRDRASQSIVLMKEHRQALLTAAVTGKIDVRGLVTDEEVAALDADPELVTTEEDFESEVVEADYITEEE